LVNVTVTGEPADTLDALTESCVGEDEPIVNVAGAEVPPGSGVKTVIDALPVVATSPLAIDAVSCVVLTNVVARAVPFQRTTDEVTKLLPLTVSVKGALPAMADEGDSELMTGVVLPPPPADPTMTVGLVADRVYPPLRKYLNS
jgi:hypothetical protein